MSGADETRRMDSVLAATTNNLARLTCGDNLTPTTTGEDEALVEAAEKARETIGSDNATVTENKGENNSTHPVREVATVNTTSGSDADSELDKDENTNTPPVDKVTGGNGKGNALENKHVDATSHVDEMTAGSGDGNGSASEDPNEAASTGPAKEMPADSDHGNVSEDKDENACKEAGNETVEGITYLADVPENLPTFDNCRIFGVFVGGDCSIDHVKLGNCTLVNVLFESCTFNDVKLFDVHLMNCTVEGCVLSNGTIRGIKEMEGFISGKLHEGNYLGTSMPNTLAQQDRLREIQKANRSRLIGMTEEEFDEAKANLLDGQDNWKIWQQKQPPMADQEHWPSVADESDRPSLAEEQKKVTPEQAEASQKSIQEWFQTNVLSKSETKQ